MHPITHLLASWSVADLGKTKRRDRAIVTLAGVLPDLDGLGFLAEMLSRDTAHAVYWFSDYHHLLMHNIGTGMGITVLAALASVRRAKTALLAASAFHLHLLCDLMGSRGADGYHWPIPYLLPFSDAWSWVWQGQWRLNAWPNIVITLMLILLTLTLGWSRGYTVVELVSRRGDRALVRTLRQRFGNPR